MSAAQFSDDGGFDFAVRCILSGVGYGMAEPGETLATAATVAAGDLDGWYDAWSALADRCDATGARLATAGHRESAAQAFLRAANYRFAAFYYVLGTQRAADHLATWQAHRASLGRAMAAWPTPIDEITISYAGTDLRGWHFRSPSAAPRPLLVIHNGLGSPLSDVFMTGAIDAVSRGWDVLAFDGPGQGHACFVDGTAPVDSWQDVGRAVLDVATRLPDVDATRIAVSGIADGGYLAARHAADDDRVAALVCDPGVVTPVDGALGGLPDRLQQAWRDGSTVQAADADESFALAKLVEQWPGHSPSDVLAALTTWDLGPIARRIACPTFVADPDAAMSFPGQSAALAALLGDRATLMPFTTSEGAGLDCEIGMPRLRNQRVFDWLDETLPGSR